MSSFGNLNDIQNRTPEAAAEGDRFYTPTELARRLVATVPFTAATESILDPCAGADAFFNQFPPSIDGLAPVAHHRCEITQGSDFFKFTQPVSWIVSNPPFSQLTRWLEHTIHLATEGFAYIMPLYAINENRLRLANDHGFEIVDIILFKNPVSWNLGFQMAFVIFEKDGDPACSLLNPPTTRQATLF